MILDEEEVGLSKQEEQAEESLVENRDDCGQDFLACNLSGDMTSPDASII